MIVSVVDKFGRLHAQIDMLEVPRRGDMIRLRNGVDANARLRVIDVEWTAVRNTQNDEATVIVEEFAEEVIPR
jgi:hypothetical protein